MRVLGLTFAAMVIQPATSWCQIPDHPIITEVFTDPNGLNDGPVGRDLSNPHQEYYEIYLPPSTSLNAALMVRKDALRLTIYEVEGDRTSTGKNLINYRFDLPTFDLDPVNGTTAGAIPRPPSGVVVLGWVDYVGDPPVDLAGTPATRLGLVNSGITTKPADYLFIAINGHHFTGTTNFDLLIAENLIDIVNPDDPTLSETRSGVIQNGSGAYLLVDRDSPGYVELCDDKHAIDCVAGANPALPDDAVGLKTSALLDGFAGNDDSGFDVLCQPLQPGNNTDLQEVLPAGGAFSLLIPQIPEVFPSSFASACPPPNNPVITFADPGMANGYARRFVDVPKTTENASSFDDDPVQDALTAYRHIRNGGPFFPTPGKVVFTNTPPELSLALGSAELFDVLAGTTREVGFLAANVGGNFPINVSAVPGSSSNPAVATFATGTSVTGVLGQEVAKPQLSVTGVSGALQGATATASVSVTASNTNAGDPPVISPVLLSSATATVLNPKTGLDASGLPLQTTVFLAVQPIPAVTGVSNEFLNTDLASFIQANFGGQKAYDTRGLTMTTETQPGIFQLGLLDPTINLNDGSLMQLYIKDFPNDPLLYLNFPAPPVAGKLDLFQTVLQSAEVAKAQSLGVPSTYDQSFDFPTSKLRAMRMNIPDTVTFGGTFSPGEPVYFADAAGGIGDPASPFSNVTTNRTFEVAIFDTNVQDNSSISTGKTDDFGIVIEVVAVEPTSPVVPGEFVFLSFSGGLQGADIDSLFIPPGPNLATLIYLDLDNLHDELGIISIEQVIFIDGGNNAGNELDAIEAWSLNRDCATPEVPGGTPDLCNDGRENDCDNLIDCADPDCASFPGCGGGCGNGTCDAGENSCNCAADCGAPPVSEVGLCTDGIDNDCDGFIDCADPDCAGPPSCCTANETACADGVDNDCDGCTDGGDADCGAVEIACTDGIDNDCDGFPDCADTDCPATCPCTAPVFTASGPRFFDLTASVNNSPVAFFISGVDQDVACVSGYVQADGVLGTNPVYLPPIGPGGWNTVHVRGADLISARTYSVQADCNQASPGTDRSAPVSAKLWQWADADNSGGLTEILDAVHILDGFRSQFHTIPCTTDADCIPVRPFQFCDRQVGKCLWNTMQNIDLMGVVTGCLPDGNIDITIDVTLAIDAFRSLPQPCATPCP